MYSIARHRWSSVSRQRHRLARYKRSQVCPTTHCFHPLHRRCHSSPPPRHCQNRSVDHREMYSTLKLHSKLTWRQTHLEDPGCCQRHAPVFPKSPRCIPPGTRLCCPPQFLWSDRCPSTRERYSTVVRHWSSVSRRSHQPHRYKRSKASPNSHHCIQPHRYCRCHLMRWLHPYRSVRPQEKCSTAPRRWNSTSPQTHQVRGQHAAESESPM